MTTHVPSLETCQRLKTAGFPQETEHSWRKSHVSQDTYIDDAVDFEDRYQLCAAPLLTEILEQLPLDYENNQQKWGLLRLRATETGTGERWMTVGYEHVTSSQSLLLAAQDANPAEAAALLWLELKGTPNA